MNHNIFVSQQKKSGSRDCVPIIVFNAEEMKRKECVRCPVRKQGDGLRVQVCPTRRVGSPYLAQYLSVSTLLFGEKQRISA